MAGESSDQRFVISKESKRTTFQEIAVMEEGGINSLELTVKSGVALLRKGEFGREKGKRWANTMNLLVKHST